MLLTDLFTNVDPAEMAHGFADTLFMLGFSVLFSALIGIPLGLTLFLTSKNKLLANSWFYNVLSLIINILRSIPFIILLILLVPVTTFLVGTSLGVSGTIPPLVFGATPFFAKLIENSLSDIETGVFDMAKSCGASTWQIIWHILLPEMLPNIIATITVTAVTLVSYTAMAGVVGGGGLGDLAIRYGYERFETDVMLVTVVLLVVLVQLIQFIGDKLVVIVRKK